MIKANKADTQWRNAYDNAGEQSEKGEREGTMVQMAIIFCARKPLSFMCQFSLFSLFISISLIESIFAMFDEGRENDSP